MNPNQNHQATRNPIVSKFVRAFTPVSVVLFAIVCSPSFAQAQVPSGYELTIMNAAHVGWPHDWDSLHEPDQEPVRIIPHDINDFGIAVGTAINIMPHHERAFLYLHNVPESREMMDLNHLGASWTDLDSGDDVTADSWYAKRAYGINHSNKIAGMAIKQLSNGDVTSRFFVLSDPLGTLPRFELLPTHGTVGRLGAGHFPRINDYGTVAANVAEGLLVYSFDPIDQSYTPIDIRPGSDLRVYDINNRGEFVSGGQIFEPDGSGGYSIAYESTSHNFSGINDLSVAAGQQIYSYQGRNKRDGIVVRFDLAHFQSTGNAQFTEIESRKGDEPNDTKINNDGVIFYGHYPSSVSFERGFICFPGVGSLPLDNLINFDSPEDEADWFLKQIEPMGINNLGQLIGRSDGHGFFLTPIAAGPSISVNDLTIDEGNSGTTTPGHFTITLSELTGQDVSVPYAIIDGNATIDDDYNVSERAGLLTFEFASGQTSKMVEFTIVGDSTRESDETFRIELGEAVGGAAVAKGVGTVTIKNDDNKGGRK